MNSAKPALAQRRAGRRSVLTKGDRTEGALLDSVEELLAEAPLTDLTLAQIAARAGLSRSSVYFYFDSKNAVVEAAALRLLERLLDDFASHAASAEEPIATSVDRYLASLSTLWRSSTPLLSAAIDLLGQRPALRAAWERALERSADSFAAVIDQKRTQGVLPDIGDSRAAALAVCWMCERTHYILYTREHTAEEEERLPATLRPLILRSIGADPAGAPSPR